MLEKEVILSLYQKMVLIRKCEEAGVDTYKKKLWKGSIHASLGQEAAPSAAAVATRPEDYFVSNHRGHGHVLAKGTPPRIFFSELFGKATGQCYGRGGSMHMMDAEHRVYPNGLVGSGAYVAAGIGMRIRYLGTREIVVAFAGDGASSTGGFHEGINMAASFHLPIVFVCENNGIAVSTKSEYALPIANLSLRAAGYGMPGVTVDGHDSLSVYHAIKNAADRARSGGGPSMVEVLCHRAVGHTGWDQAGYRTSLERNAWRYSDPIIQLRLLSVGEGLFSDAQLDAIDAEIDAVVQDAITYALAAPEPEASVEEALRFVYQGGSL